MKLKKLVSFSLQLIVRARNKMVNFEYWTCCLVSIIVLALKVKRYILLLKINLVILHSYWEVVNSVKQGFGEFIEESIFFHVSLEM